MLSAIDLPITFSSENLNFEKDFSSFFLITILIFSKMNCCSLQHFLWLTERKHWKVSNLK